MRRKQSGLVDTTENIDLMVALNPRGGYIGSIFQVTCSTDPGTLSCQLKTRHRNSAPIQRFMKWYQHHMGYLLSVEYAVLSPSEDNVPPVDQLPFGEVPLWLQRTKMVTDREILERVKERHIENCDSVTVLYSKHDQEARNWCEEQGWMWEADYKFYGCEDEVIITIDCPLVPEVISRERKRLVVVTTRGKW